MTDKLPGKHAEVSINGTLLDLTKDDVTISGDEEIIEDRAHSDEFETRLVVGAAPSIEIESFVDGDLTLFEEAGIIDGTTYQPAREELEEVTVLIYETPNATDPEVEITAQGVIPEWSDDLSLPEDDFAEYGVTFHVNGSLDIDNPA